MKIIKRGKPKKKEKKKTCHECKTVFLYKESDINVDRDGIYVICPVCKAFIAV